MKITLLDRSNYFRGLLLLLRKDNVIAKPEIDMMRHVGKVLGFDPSFCERAIEEVLHNVHISNEAPVFSSKAIAEKFIRDGLALAMSDSNLHSSEEQWLKDTAEKNGIPHNVISQLKIMPEESPRQAASLEVNGLIVSDE